MTSETDPNAKARRPIHQRPNEWCQLLLVLVLFILINLTTDLISMEHSHALIKNMSGMIRGSTGSQLKNNFQERKMFAQQALDLMEHEAVFESTLTNSKTVLERGFPFQWDPCTLLSIFRQNDEHGTPSDPLKIVFLGETATARAADSCTPKGSDDPLEGRFTNILKRSLENDSDMLVEDHQDIKIDFEVSNLAQGGVGSVYSAMTLDSKVDPANVDVLVYEFFINDNWNADHADVIKLEMWLIRVKAFFERKGQKVPPIMLLFLWEENIGMEHMKNKVLKHGLDKPLFGAWKAIERYKKQGWNIQALSVGSTFEKMFAIASNPGLIVDDQHHPNCFSVHHIADMIRHAIYTDMATCKELPLRDARQPIVEHRSAWRDNLLSEFDAEPDTKNILDFLLREDIKVASLTPWQPPIVGSTDLSIGNVEELKGYQIAQTSPQVDEPFPSREDRRRGFPIPACSTHQGGVTFVLKEPNLEWLGVNLHPIGEGVDIEAVEWTVNGHTMGLVTRKLLPMKFVTNWIRVSESLPTRTKEYKVKFCNTDPEGGTIQLQHLVGIMRPALTERESDLLELLNHGNN
ncbi:expressed unknown protein [Seminavis robusta]|uniref:Uncharacterized protein n=1 Tax=Seminavis robusta TaxID=568900 RepID=A0A9N8EFX2_9STRA|nr:expressed unknown protein [Seminavis robusta]|eukprot:Sro932_g221670.1 n/a (576) ;mRNA; f:28460-30298